MSTDVIQAQAWPYLVGRGHRVGYRVLAGPAFMVEQGQTAVLQSAEVDPSGSADAMRVSVLDGPQGRVTVVSTTETMSAAKLSPSFAPDRDTDRPLLDMHSRPLVIQYGFVARGTATGEVDRRDLEASRAAAIARYRSFLRNEQDSTIVSTEPFTLATNVERETPTLSGPDERPPAPRQLPAPPQPRPESPPVHTPTAGGPSAVGTEHESAAAAADRDRRSRVVTALVVLGLVAVLAIGVAVLRGNGEAALSSVDSCSSITTDRPSCEIFVGSRAAGTVTLRPAVDDPGIEVQGCTVDPGGVCRLTVSVDPAVLPIDAEVTIGHDGRGGPLAVSVRSAPTVEQSGAAPAAESSG